MRFTKYGRYLANNMAGNIDILIIDDEESKSELLKDSLLMAIENYNKLRPDKELVHAVTEISTVEGALLNLDNKPYQLVMLDYDLDHPRINGETLVKIIRSGKNYQSLEDDLQGMLKTEINKSTYICGCSKIWCMEGSPEMSSRYKNNNTINEAINMDFNYLANVGYGYVVRKLEKVIHELADAVF